MGGPADLFASYRDRHAAVRMNKLNHDRIAIVSHRPVDWVLIRNCLSAVSVCGAWRAILPLSAYRVVQVIKFPLVYRYGPPVFGGSSTSLCDLRSSAHWLARSYVGLRP